MHEYSNELDQCVMESALVIIPSQTRHHTAPRSQKHSNLKHRPYVVRQLFIQQPIKSTLFVWRNFAAFPVITF